MESMQYDFTRESIFRAKHKPLGHLILNEEGVEDWKYGMQTIAIRHPLIHIQNKSFFEESFGS